MGRKFWCYRNVADQTFWHASILTRRYPSLSRPQVFPAHRTMGRTIGQEPDYEHDGCVVGALALLRKGHCTGLDAVDAKSVMVRAVDPEAVRWSLYGALLRVTGGPRPDRGAPVS